AVAHHYRAAIRTRRRISLIDKGLAHATVLALSQTRYRWNLSEVVLALADTAIQHHPDFALGILIQELRCHPSEQVVDDRFGVRDLRILAEPGRLEPHVRKLVDQELQRYAILQRVRDCRRERIHQPRDGRTLLRHRDKNLAGRSVLVHADRDVTLVARDIELVRNRLALVRQLAADRAQFVWMRGERL